MKKLFASLFLSVLCAESSSILLAGCNQVPLTGSATTQQSQATFNQSVLVAVTSVTELRQAAITLLSLGSITKEQAQKTQDVADQARAAIDISIALHAAGKFADAESSLNSTMNILLFAKEALSQGVKND